MAAEARAQYILAFSCFDVIFFSYCKRHECVHVHTHTKAHACIYINVYIQIKGLNLRQG